MKASIAIVIGYVFLSILTSDSFFFDSGMIIFSNWYSDEVTISKNYVAMLQSRDLDGIKEKIDPSNNRDQAVEALATMANLFPVDKPVSIATTGIYHTTKTTNGSPPTTNITLEYEYPDRWIEVAVFLKESNGDHTILGFHVQKTEESLKKKYAFNWYSRNMADYLFLAIACAISIITVMALISCVRSADVKRKWLWIPFILVGFVLVSLDWTDDIVRIDFLTYHLPNAGLGRTSPYAPMKVFASIPLGAIIFLLRRKIRRS